MLHRYMYIAICNYPQGIFQYENQRRRVIVPMNGVETYDANEHDGDTLHNMALYIMYINGVDIVESIN